VNDLKQFISIEIKKKLEEIIKIVSKTINLKSLKNKLETCLDIPEISSKLDEYMQKDSKISDNTYLDILKNTLKSFSLTEQTVNEILEMCQINNIERVTESYLTSMDFCQATCFICRAQCTAKKNHSGPHCTEFHIPSMFLGKFF
jgi:hypothetical protein